MIHIVKKKKRASCQFIWNQYPYDSLALLTTKYEVQITNISNSKAGYRAQCFLRPATLCKVRNIEIAIKGRLRKTQEEKEKG